MSIISYRLLSAGANIDTSASNKNIIKKIYNLKYSEIWYEKIYKINIRSKGPVINEIASNFNGGGHKYASGARIKTRKEVDELFKALDKASEEYLNIEYE